MTRYTPHLGFETDLMLVAFDGRVQRRDGYWVARRPRSPDHVWGNLLVLDAPPAAATAEVERWTTCFRNEFSSGTRHVALGWPAGPAEAVHPFVARGFDPIDAVTLATRAPQFAPGAASDAVVRPLRSNSEWRAAAALTRQMHGERPDPRLDAWLERQLRRHRSLVDAGLGAWYGAFLGATLAACLGLYVRAEDGLARYQLVVTGRRYRRRGLALRLVAEAGLDARARLGAETLVILAEPHGPAADLYRASGFTDVARSHGVIGGHRRRT